MIYAPVEIFLFAVLAWFLFNGSAGTSSIPAIYAGFVGLAPVVVSAYLINERAAKGMTDVGRVAAILLVAHGVLFLLLLLKPDASSRDSG